MPLPDASGAAQRLIHSAATVGCALSAHQADQLLAYLALLLKWNRIHNLTAITTAEEAVSIHLLDCLAVMAPLRRYLSARSADPGSADQSVAELADAGLRALPGATAARPAPSTDPGSFGRSDLTLGSTTDVQAVPKPSDVPLGLPDPPLTPAHQAQACQVTSDARLLDIGSGGGLPGVVIAIAAPSLEVVCVDAVAKKTAFITQAQAELRLPNLTAKHGRVEHLTLPGFDIITSRAVGSLRELVQWSHSLLNPGGAWMAMKGTVPTAEIAELCDHAEVFHVEQLQIPTLRAQRCLVWMRPPRDSGSN